MTWMCVVSIIGVLLAFPMKRRFINEEQLPFPEGRASGVVLDALYTGGGQRGHVQGAAARLARRSAPAIYQAVISDGWMKLLQFKILRMDQWAGMKEPWTFHERLDSYYYAAVGEGAASTSRRSSAPTSAQLGLRLTLDAAMLGVGGLMGIAVATSCLLGAFINFVILAPIMIQRRRHRRPRRPTGAVVPISRAEIVNQWSLWWGVTMMVVGSLVSLLGRPEIFKGLFKRGATRQRPRRAHAHRVAAVDLGGRRADLQRARGGGHARVLRRAVAARVHLAAAHFRAVDHLHQLDGAHVVDAHRRAVQDHAVHDGRDRPHQSGEQPDPGGHDGRDRRQRRQPALRHQARLHARRASRASRRSAT